MDKKSLFWWYGHLPVETDLKHRFMVEIMGKAGEKVKIDRRSRSGTNPHFEALRPV